MAGGTILIKNRLISPSETIRFKFGVFTIWKRRLFLVAVE